MQHSAGEFSVLLSMDPASDRGGDTRWCSGDEKTEYSLGVQPHHLYHLMFCINAGRSADVHRKSGFFSGGTGGAVRRIYAGQHLTRSAGTGLRCCSRQRCNEHHEFVTNDFPEDIW